MRRLYLLAVFMLIVSFATGCSAKTAEGPVKKPQNVSNGAETLDPAPTGVVEDTPSWTELPKPVADALGTPQKGKFQAFKAMKTATVAAQLGSAPDAKAVFKALDAAAPFVPEDYSILLHLYAPDAEGALKFTGYEWTPLSGALVRKTSADADQSWDAAITAITDGTATEMQPPAVKKVAAGEMAPPLFAP